MDSFHLLNEVYGNLNQKKKQLLALIKQAGLKYRYGYYDNHSIKVEGEFVTEQYPIPVISIEEYGDIGLDLNQTFFEVKMKRETAIHMDYRLFENYSFELYGVDDYLNDFYNESMEITQIAKMIEQSKEKEVDAAFYFETKQSVPELWNQIVKIHDYMA